MSSVAIKETTPIGLAFFRVTIGALTLTALAWMMGLRFPQKLGEWRAFAVLAVIGNVMPFVMLYWAQTRITGGLASILNATAPVFTLVLAHIFTKDEKIGIRSLAGVAAAIAGIATIIGPSALSHSGNLWAEVAVLATACCYAAGSVYGRRFKNYPPIITSVAQLIVGALILLPLVAVEASPFHGRTPSLATLASIAGIGILCTALAFIIFFRILARAGAANAALVTLLVPGSAILLGALILGDRLVARQYAGLALILIGLLVIDGRPLEYLRDRLSRRPRGTPDASGRPASPMLNEPQQSQ
jgi:drug/metabolite transporter (DMT)-like permease